jgi:hypothetical protein
VDLIPATAIAYRASRLLHLHQIFGKGSVTDWSVDRDRGMRCFWACWLTKCASQENARFQVDCWADVIGCPLPDDGADGSPTVPRRCLGKHGLIQDIRPTQQNPFIGFNSALIIIQGHWCVFFLSQLSRLLLTNGTGGRFNNSPRPSM